MKMRRLHGTAIVCTGASRSLILKPADDWRRSHSHAFPGTSSGGYAVFSVREQAKLQWYGESYEYRDFFRYLSDPRGTSQIQWRVAFKNKADLQKLEKSLVRKKTEREHGASTIAKTRRA